MGADLRRTSAHGFRELLDGRRILDPPSGERGGPKYSDVPRFLFDKQLGLPPRDLEEYWHYWLVSNKTKAVLEGVDPDGFVFVECDVLRPDGAVGPAYWLCDVIRILDAVDEAASRLKIYDEQGPKSYSLVGGATLVFKEAVVGEAHVFRMAHLKPAVICDQQLKDACKVAGLRGISFRDAANY